MFSFIRRLFGNGKVRYNVTCIDRYGKVYNGVIKVPRKNNWTEEEMTKHVVDLIYYERGMRVLKCYIEKPY